MPKATRTPTTKPVTVPQKAAAQPVVDCPVVAIMKKMEGLWDAHCELDVVFKSSDHSIRDAMADIWRARNAYGEIVTLTRAKSLEGALFQLCLIRDAVSEFPDHVTDNAVHQGMDMLERKIERLCYSIAGVLREVIGDPARTYAVDLYLPDRIDPLKKIETAVAGQPIAELFRDELKRASPLS